MKKMAFVAVLVAAIVGIVFGCITLASATPAAKPNVVMESYSGNVTVSNNLAMPLSFSYTKAAHVSVTVGWMGTDAMGDSIDIGNNMGSWGFYMWAFMWKSGDMAGDWHTCEFNTDSWVLRINDMGGQALQVYWRVTVTYPA